MLRIIPSELITVKIDYYMPDYHHIINEFIWQTNDQWPEIPRIHRFLNYWHKEIRTPIAHIFVAKHSSNWRIINHEY